MGRAQSDTYSSLFTKSDNVNLDETFDRKSLFVHVLKVLEKCTKNLIGHSRLAFNNHESNIDCKIFGHFRQ